MGSGLQPVGEDLATLPRASRLPQYPWLKSAYDVPVWIISDPQPGQKKSLRWDVLFHDQSRLTDPQHAGLLAVLRTVTAGLRSGPFAATDDAATQVRQATNLLRLTKWMRLNGIERYDKLTREDFEDFREQALFGHDGLLDVAARIRNVAERYRSGQDVPPVLRKGTTIDRTAVLNAAGLDAIHTVHSCYELDRLAAECGHYLSPAAKKRLDAGPPDLRPVQQSPLGIQLQSWDFLWRMRSVLPAPSLTFNPFEEQSPFAMAAADAGSSARTRTAPALQTMHLIDRSIRWVLFYAEDLLRLRDELLREIEAGEEKVSQELRIEDLITYLAHRERDGTLPISRNAPMISQIARDLSWPRDAFNNWPPAIAAIDDVRSRLGLLGRCRRKQADDTLLTLRQASVRSGINRSTLYSCVRRGDLLNCGTESLLLVRAADLEQLNPPATHRRAGSMSDSEKQLANLLARRIEGFRPVRRGPGDPWPLEPIMMARRARVDVNTAVNHFLPLACFVIICAFSARRYMEVTGLREQPRPGLSVIMGEPGERWLAVWIEKTIRDWDLVPVPEIVVKAVEVLRRWSAPARLQNGNQLLFQWPSWRLNASKKSLEVGQVLEKFARFLQVPEVPGTGEWKFAPHQFRRFFAVLYMWRYEAEGKSLEALSDMLRHFHASMTRRYLTENAEGAIFHEVQVHETKQILTAVARKQRTAGGGFVASFHAAGDRARSRLEASVTVLPKRQAEEFVSRFVDNNKVVLQPLPWGFCACPTTAASAATANCRKGCDLRLVTGPDLAAAKPSLCAFCAHNMTGPQFAQTWEKHLVQLRETAEDATNSPLMRAEAARELDIEARYARANVFVQEEQ